MNVLAPELRSDLGVARFHWAMRCAVIDRKWRVFDAGVWKNVDYVVVPLAADGAALDIAAALPRKQP